MTFRWFALPIIFFVYMFGIFNLYDGIVSQAEANSLRHLGIFEDDYNTVDEVLNSIVFLSPQHAPLYFIALNYWYQTFGSDPGILRLFSVFSGVLMVAVIYRFGMEIVPQYGGPYASLMVLSSWSFMYYLHEIRQYALLMLVSSILFLLYWKIINRKSPVPIGYWVALFITSALSVYIHYFGILSLIGIGLYHLLFVKKNRRWFYVVVAEILAGVTFLPWLRIMRTGMNTMPDLSNRSLQPLQVVYEFLFFHGNGLWFVLLALILLVAWRYRRLTAVQRFVFVVFVFMIGAIFIIHLIRPILFTGRLRYIIIFLPILALMLSVALAQLTRKPWLPFGVIGLLLVAGVVLIRSDLLYDYAGLDRMPPYDDVLDQMEAFPGMSETLISLSVPDDNVLVSLQVEEYYGKLTGRRVVHFTDGPVNDSYRSIVDKVARNDVGFWLLYYPNTVPLDNLTLYNDLFLDHFRACHTFMERDDLLLIFMLQKALPCDFVSSPPPQVMYDSGAALWNSLLQVTDDNLDVYMWWRNITPEAYGTSIQIFDEAGNRVIQDDYVVVEAFQHRQYEWRDMPAGEYDVQMILYTVGDVSSIGGYLMPEDVYFDRSFSIGTVTVDID